MKETTHIDNQTIGDGIAEVPKYITILHQTPTSIQRKMTKMFASKVFRLYISEKKITQEILRRKVFAYI